MPDMDILRVQLAGHALRHAAQRKLAHGEGGGLGIALDAGRRAREQDGAAAALKHRLRGRGTILFTGASASIKGYAHSAAFAMGKFALRGMAQSMARELHPQNIHIGHVIIDGGIRQADGSRDAERGEDGLLEPDAIAETYLQLHRQHRSASAWEIELRPWRENF